MRARRNETPEQLAGGRARRRTTRPARSLAVLGLLLQIAIIYWFNYVHKSGVTWKDGTAVYYVLHQERIITWLGLQIREHVPYWVTALLTRGTLVVEALVPLLVLTPIFWRWTRPLALVLLVGLHGSIAAMVNLGIFSAAMIAYDPFLLNTVQWQLFGRLVPRKRPRARRLLRRRLRRLLLHRARAGAAGCVPAPALVSNRDRTALPADVDGELLDKTMLVVNRHADMPEAPGRRWTRAEAVYQCLARAAVRAAVGVAAARARAQPAGGRRVRRLRAQPDAHLDLARAGGVWRAGRARAGLACGPVAGCDPGPRCRRRCRRRGRGCARACRWCASWASGWCS